MNYFLTVLSRVPVFFGAIAVLVMLGGCASQTGTSTAGAVGGGAVGAAFGSALSSVGALLGAGVGALGGYFLAQQIRKWLNPYHKAAAPVGRTAAITAGLYGSYLLARRLLETTDRGYRQKAAYRGIVDGKLGQRVSWYNPQTRHGGSFILKRFFRNRKGKLCQIQKVAVGVGQNERIRTLCQLDRDAWIVTDSVPVEASLSSASLEPTYSPAQPPPAPSFPAAPPLAPAAPSPAAPSPAAPSPAAPSPAAPSPAAPSPAAPSPAPSFQGPSLPPVPPQKKRRPPVVPLSAIAPNPGAMVGQYLDQVASPS